MYNFINTFKLIIKNINCKDIIVIQYPFIKDKFLKLLPKEKTIILVHDLMGLRTNNIKKQKEEIDTLNKFKYIIVHNSKMRYYLEKNKSGFATAGLVLGIIGICTSFIPIVNNISFILGLIGAIFGIIALIKKASKGQAIAGIILCILAIAITINSQKALSDSLNTWSQDIDKATGNSTEEVLKNDVDVQLGTFQVTKSTYTTETVLKVNVKNKTNDTKSFSIQVEAVDANGSRIANDYVYANNLNAGQSQEFKIFEYVESDKVNLMKNATFKIVEASMY